MKNEAQEPEASELYINPIPSLLTICNALCGFSAILHVMASPAGQIPVLSFWMIGLAIFFDMLDGWSARKLNAQSLHGVNLDSMADTVSFGLAPAVMIYHVAQGDAPGVFRNLAWLAAAFFLGAALWRLAQFNTNSTDESAEKEENHAHFSGLPTPGATGLICCAMMLVPSLNVSNTVAFFIYMAYAALSAYLMNAPLCYNHLIQDLAKENKWIRISVTVLFLTSLIIFKQWALIAFAHLYVLYAPLSSIQSAVATHRMRYADMTPDDDE